LRLGTDDARPFRLVLEAGRFTKGRPISVVAIARSSSGAVTASAPQLLTRP
jgi:hypothetical protein